MTNIFILAIMALVFFLLSIVFISIWVYKDAKQRGLPAGIWVLLIVLGGNFIGLILYLLIGRKQGRVCGHCGSATSAQGAFCPACGEKLTVQQRSFKTNRGYLIMCAASIALAFASVGLCIFSAFNSEGFTYERRYSYYNAGLTGSAKNISQRSSGNTWDISFDEASDGYTVSKTYNSTSQPISLSLDFSCSGSVQLLIMQKETSINETVKEGSYNFDMSGFKSGKINIKIINIDASDFSGKIKMD